MFKKEDAVRYRHDLNLPTFLQCLINIHEDTMNKIHVHGWIHISVVRIICMKEYNMNYVSYKHCEMG